MSHIGGAYKIIKDNMSKFKLFDEKNKFFKTKSYEEPFANAINGTCVTKKGDQRYWDCVDSTKQIKIELKKSKSNVFYLDLIRYYEILLAVNGNYDNIVNYPEQARIATSTAFVCTTPNKKITCMYIVDSADLLSILKIARKDDFTDEELIDEARRMVSWYNELLKVGNRINMQFHLKVKNIEKMPSVKKITF